MIKEVIVVEGKSDTTAIRRAVDADTIETGGSAIGEAVLKRIERAQRERGVIILTDPDHAGERIRRIVSTRIKGCKHAFLTKEQARRNQKYGVEHATPEDIHKALIDVRSEHEKGTEVVELEQRDLIEAGMLWQEDAAWRRKIVGELLGIGYANGKQFLYRLQSFRVRKSEWIQAIEQLARIEQELENIERDKTL